MVEPHHCYGIPDIGIPDIELSRSDGGTINPAHLVGHELVVLFCPTKAEVAVREIEAYARHAQDLCDNDAWIIGINNIPELVQRKAGDHGNPIAIASDPEHLAWAEFKGLLKPSARTGPEDGAVFLFGRGGVLRRAWQGSGHAAEVLRELILT